MAKLGYTEKDGMLHLVIVPEGSIETALVFELLHWDEPPLKVEGEVVFSPLGGAPRITIKGNVFTADRKRELHNAILFIDTL